MLVLTLLLLNAAPPTVEESARIELEQAEAQRAVDAKYGNKKPSELTPQQTRAKIRDQAVADEKVLAGHGTTAKEWSRNALKKQRGEYAEEQRDVKALAEKKKEPAPPATAQAELPAEQVLIERAGDGPAEPDADHTAAAEADAAMNKAAPGKTPPGAMSKKPGKSRPPPAEKKKKKKTSTD